MEPTLTQYGVAGCLTVVLLQMILNWISRQRVCEQSKEILRKIENVKDTVNDTKIWHAEVKATWGSLEQAIERLTTTIAKQTDFLGMIMGEIKDVGRTQ